MREHHVSLVYAPYRVWCRRCGLRVERVPWADQWQRVTHALARAVAALDLEAIEAKMREQVAADVPFERLGIRGVEDAGDGRLTDGHSGRSLRPIG